MARGIAIATGMILLVMGCIGEPDRALFDIESVTPDRLEPGDVLKIRGSGFPLGYTPEVSIAGVLHRPGQETKRVTVVVEGRVESASIITVEIDDSRLAAFGDRGTLVGRLRVGFTTPTGSWIYGERSVTLDILPATRERLKDQPGAIASAERFAASLGLTLSPEQSDLPGMQVTEVMAGSNAATIGLRPGDRIVELGALRLHTLTDFLPPTDSPRVSLRVQRAGTAGSFMVNVRTMDADHETSRHRALGVSLAFAGFVLGLFGPFRAIFVAAEARGSARPPRRAGSSARRLRALVLGVVGIGLGWLASLGQAPALGWWILGFTALAAADRFMAARSRSSPRLRLWSSIWVLVGMVLVCGTFDIGVAVQRQGVLPHQWWFFQHPAAFLLFFAAMFALQPAPAPPKGVPSLALGLLARGAMVFVVVALFFGGWQVPPEQPRLLLPAVVATKVVIVVALSRHVRIDERIIPWLLSASMLLAVYTFWTGSTPALAALTPPVVLGLLVGAAVSKTLSMRRPRDPIAVPHWQL